MGSPDIPDEVGGLPVLAVCQPAHYAALASGEGMRISKGGALRSFESLAVCVDRESGGVFVFRCGADWEVIADDWYQGAEVALAAIEQQYPGITEKMTRAQGNG